MSTFLGIGFGPIQTGIFLKGAFEGDMDRLVIAEVDQSLVDAVRAADGEVTINIAAVDRIYQESFTGVEIYNPTVDADLEQLIAIAAEADEIATALPGVDFFKFITPWLKKGFLRKPDKTHFIYTAENNNHAAEVLAEALGDEVKNCYCLNTVVGKMSGVISEAEGTERKLAMLCATAGKGHLVEEFSQIFISQAPGIAKRSVTGLYEKADLYPFEEAKLYGHNAIHFLLGALGKAKGYTYMSELAAVDELMALAEQAFIDECGAALCKKYSGVDELFTATGFKHYADDLLKRMTNPFLTDAIERITRDLPRKLGWNDRIIGTMRLALDQGIKPTIIARGATLAAAELFGETTKAITVGAKELWPTPWTDEHQQLLELINSD
jgi:mannitol-1-phosphate 5-dehydrogenase